MFTTFTMHDESTRAKAFRELESMGYHCSLDEKGGLLLVDVDHDVNDSGTVRWMVRHVDPEAIILRP